MSTGISVVNEANGAFERIKKEIEEVGAQIGQVSLQSSDISHKSQTALEVLRSIEASSQTYGFGYERCVRTHGRAIREHGRNRFLFQRFKRDGGRIR